MRQARRTAPAKVLPLSTNRPQLHVTPVDQAVARHIVDAWRAWETAASATYAVAAWSWVWPFVYAQAAAAANLHGKSRADSLQPGGLGTRGLDSPLVLPQSM